VKIALLSDVHGNLPALETVIADIPSDVDTVICLGDIVGYGPYPLECARIVFQHCDLVRRAIMTANYLRQELQVSRTKLSQDCTMQMNNWMTAIESGYRSYPGKPPSPTRFCWSTITLKKLIGTFCPASFPE